MAAASAWPRKPSGSSSRAWRRSSSPRRPPSSRSLLSEIAGAFGSQSVVAGIDVKRNWMGRTRAYVASGTRDTGFDPVALATRAVEHGAGEILLNVIDRDGAMKGYDLPLVSEIAKAVGVPVIACGGAGSLADIGAVIGAGASGAAAGSLFVFKGPHRAVLINYPTQTELAALLAADATNAEWIPGYDVTNDLLWAPSTCRLRYQVCSRCVMDTSDPKITFDGAGVCNHCHAHEATLARQMLSARKAGRGSMRSRPKSSGRALASRYDCIIGVSGGVDSTYTAWLVKQLGLRPLAVHLDNGWNSEIAVKNIANALERLKIDLHTHVIDWDEYRDIQRAFLLASVPDVEVPS